MSNFQEIVHQKMDHKSLVDTNKLPKHVAVIMDGNGRWAKEKNQPRVFGHRNGVKAVRETAEAAAEIGIEYLTFYAFSTENWRRPKLEVDALMHLLVETLAKEIKTLNKNNIKLQAIGNLGELPERTHKALKEGIAATAGNTRMTMILALNYSSKSEITYAAKTLAAKVADGTLSLHDIDEQCIADSLYTAGVPDPELLIRTSGELRLSNFLLWQLAYAELIFLPVFWPDFNKDQFFQALVEYQKRERRFGKTSEQIV